MEGAGLDLEELMKPTLFGEPTMDVVLVKGLLVHEFNRYVKCALHVQDTALGVGCAEGKEKVSAFLEPEF